MPKFLILRIWYKFPNDVEMVFWPALRRWGLCPKGRRAFRKECRWFGRPFVFLEIIKTPTTLMYKSIIFLLIFLVLISGCSINQTPKQKITKPKLKQTCSCRSDRHNCDDFETGWEAQQMYECCMQKVGYDIHQLDRDDDGRACEW